MISMKPFFSLNTLQKFATPVELYTIPIENVATLYAVIGIKKLGYGGFDDTITYRTQFLVHTVLHACDGVSLGSDL